MKLASTLSLALGLSLAACAQSGTVANRTVESVKVPVVEQSMLAYDVAFDARNRLAAGQAQALTEYLASIGVAYGDRISLDDRGGTGVTQRRAAVAEVVARRGLLLESSAPVSARPLAPGMARVVIVRARAYVPGCPDWSRPSEVEVEASAMSNFGCATRGNLAEMIADPNDLVVGKSYSGGDGQTGASAIGAYRNPASRSAPAPAPTRASGN